MVVSTAAQAQPRIRTHLVNVQAEGLRGLQALALVRHAGADDLLREGQIDDRRDGLRSPHRRQVLVDHVLPRAMSTSAVVLDGRSGQQT